MAHTTTHRAEQHHAGRYVQRMSPDVYETSSDTQIKVSLITHLLVTGHIYSEHPTTNHRRHHEPEDAGYLRIQCGSDYQTE
jgi:hypothetical protein